MAEQRTARDVCSIEHVTGRGNEQGEKERESDVELAPFHGKKERKKEGGRGSKHAGRGEKDSSNV